MFAPEFDANVRRIRSSLFFVSRRESFRRERLSLLLLTRRGSELAHSNALLTDFRSAVGLLAKN